MAFVAPFFAGISPSPGEKAPAGALAETPARAVILVLDDERLVRWSMRERLSRQGYEVLEAENGEEALTLLRTHHVDLVLLDFELPGIDGLAVLRRIRAEQIPCTAILMTAYGTPELEELAARSGVRRFVAKPFDPDEIAAVVDEELSGH